MQTSNLIIFSCLIKKEIKRFLKVYQQTIITPIITGTIFYLIFILANDSNLLYVHNIPYKLFISSGIIAMTMMQQSFANSSSSITSSKIMGNFIDYQIAPISENCFIFAFTLAASIRGILVGIIILLVMNFFININIYDWLLLIFVAMIGNLILAILGVIAGIVSNSFEQMSSFSTYFIMPLSFLSGTFYTIKKLPLILEKFNYANPFFYIIDIFRYSLTGYHDSNITFGVIYLILVFLILYSIAYLMIKSGYKIKS